MNAEILAEWFRAQGHRVVRTESSYWCDQGFRVYQAFPYHWVITPSERELSRFMLRAGAIGARYSTPLDTPQGSVSYHCIYDGGCYDLVDLPRRARGAVRKGLRNASVEQISLETLADEGWRLRLETMQRQERVNSEKESAWKRMCLAARDLPGFEAWGCFCRGQLAAALLAVTCDDCYTLLCQQSATEHLNSGVNNVLAYVVTHEAANRDGICQVFYGLESLNASQEVDVFKARMGYCTKLLRQRVVFHPGLKPFVDLLGQGVVTQLTKRYPNNTTFSRINGMLRFYENGKLPMEQQSYPPVVADKLAEREPEMDEVEAVAEPA
ncbi:hypothetical protein [Aggregatilinea lenta]|uniref:hypothetical protein n=1 Tax=Aggregatilinea lenta TaxID=913108 RepID=UPI000E5A3C39|nr:hypothetical protein [Aggregatilinea lenta]